MLAKASRVRQPAHGTKDRHCACKATCQRSAHGRCAGTWAALSPSAPWQSPPGRSSSWWPAHQEQDEAAANHIIYGLAHGTSMTFAPRPGCLAARPLHVHPNLSLLHLCRMTCNGPMCAWQRQGSSPGEHCCDVSAHAVRQSREGCHLLAIDAGQPVQHPHCRGWRAVHGLRRHALRHRRACAWGRASAPLLWGLVKRICIRGHCFLQRGDG